MTTCPTCLTDLGDLGCDCSMAEGPGGLDPIWCADCGCDLKPDDNLRCADCETEYWSRCQ